MVSGDAHMAALDDGSHSGYSGSGHPGFPVLQAGALDRPGSIKGGPYSHGTFPGGGQFGTITITRQPRGVASRGGTDRSHLAQPRPRLVPDHLRRTVRLARSLPPLRACRAVTHAPGRPVRGATPAASKVGATKNVMSSGVRLPVRTCPAMSRHRRSASSRKGGTRPGTASSSPVGASVVSGPVGGSAGTSDPAAGVFCTPRWKRAWR